jgi:hypothetical protein
MSSGRGVPLTHGEESSHHSDVLVIGAKLASLGKEEKL